LLRGEIEDKLPEPQLERVERPARARTDPLPYAIIAHSLAQPADLGPRPGSQHAANDKWLITR